MTAPAVIVRRQSRQLSPSAPLALLAEVLPRDIFAALALWRAVAPVLYREILGAVEVDGARVRAAGPSRVPWRWHARQGYLTAAGRTATMQGVRGALDVVIGRRMEHLRQATNELRQGERPLDDWRDLMRDDVKRLHIVAAALAVGGAAQLTEADRADLTERIAAEYGHLDRYALGIAAGTTTINAGRTTLYPEAARATFYAFELGVMIARGFHEERNVLNPADHCADCIAETNRGWVPLGALIPIGARTCRARCRCFKRYR